MSDFTLLITNCQFLSLNYHRKLDEVDKWPFVFKEEITYFFLIPFPTITGEILLFNGFKLVGSQVEWSRENLALLESMV